MHMFLRPNTQWRLQSAAVLVGTAIAAWAADQAAALAPPAPVAAPAVAAAPVAWPAASHSAISDFHGSCVATGERARCGSAVTAGGKLVPS